MYVEACARLRLPFSEVRNRLLSVRPQRGRRMTLSGKTVQVDLDRPFDGNDVVSLPVRWQATWPSAVYPSFDGELELVRLADDSAELWLLGGYRTPLGPIGKILDRTLLHTIANDGVHHMLDGLVSKLEHPAAA
jgi:hypothetical protein